MVARAKPPESISPSLVKQYMYYPVRPWLQAWLGVEEPPTDSMKQAAEALKPPSGEGQVCVRSSRGSA